MPLPRLPFRDWGKGHARRVYGGCLPGDHPDQCASRSGPDTGRIRDPVRRSSQVADDALSGFAILPVGFDQDGGQQRTLLSSVRLPANEHDVGRVLRARIRTAWCLHHGPKHDSWSIPLSRGVNVLVTLYRRLEASLRTTFVSRWVCSVLCLLHTSSISLPC